ncbi:MAG TPA: hypothetical protein GX699_03165, partial [Firmicutes bacterium]|nr:hypothetical protein [Bacillota bacterium]
VVTTNRQGQTIKVPLITISIVIVTNVAKELTSHLEISEIAAELKKKAKAMPGSIFLQDGISRRPLPEMTE